MTLSDKVIEVEKVFQELDNEIAQFQSWSTLHCKWGCGKCCFHPEVEATILEFLPFALSLYRQQRAMEWLEKLKESDATVCLILDATQAGAGLCSQYPHRGLICRLFGYSARTNKYGKKELVTCQIIKTEQTDAFDKAEVSVEAGEPIPVMSDFYMKLRSIDESLADKHYPINVAIRLAIETVLHYYSYREDEKTG